MRQPELLLASLSSSLDGAAAGPDPRTARPAPPAPAPPPRPAPDSRPRRWQSGCSDRCGEESSPARAPRAPQIAVSVGARLTALSLTALLDDTLQLADTAERTRALAPMVEEFCLGA